MLHHPKKYGKKINELTEGEYLSITETINDSLAIVKITAIKDWR